MTRARTHVLLAALLAAASACASERVPSATVTIAFPATALPTGTTAVRLAVRAADMAPVVADLPLDGSVLALEIPAGRDRVFTADAFAGALRTHTGSTTVRELVAGQETTVSIRLLPIGPPDTTPPAVVATSPASGATGVATGTLVVADFTEALDPATVTTASFALVDGAGAPVAGTVTLSASGTTATFAPAAPLAGSTTYTATLSATAPNAIRDLAGNALAAGVSWSFATAAVDTTPPFVTSQSPPRWDPRFELPWLYVPPATPIRVTFSEPMDPATVNGSTFLLRDCLGGTVPATVTYSGLEALLVPAAPLLDLAGGCILSGLFEARLTTGMRDVAGNALPAEWPWTFVVTPPSERGVERAVAAGGTHTLAYAGNPASRMVYAWGTNEGGALGTGQAIGLRQATPRRIPLDLGGGSLFARSWYSMTVNHVWGWGPAIALPTLDNPIPVRWPAVPPGGATVILSTGYAHTLLVDTVFPSGVRTVWGWGDETGGRLGPALGHGNLRQVPGLAGIHTVAAGRGHSLALRADGAVLAWGENAFGQLGDGTTTGRSDPRPVLGLADVALIAAGDDFSLAVRYDRTVYAWGRNDHGQLGDGTFVDRPAPVRVVGLPPVEAVSAGATHALALLPDSTVRAWGHNAGGKLGDGTTVDRSLPVMVVRDVVFGGFDLLFRVVEVKAGEFHSVARAVDETGTGWTVWTWGGNSRGQLGDGTTTDSPLPLQVQLDTTPAGLVSVSPADAATDVPTTAEVVAGLSEPIDPAWIDFAGQDVFALSDAAGSPVSGTLAVAGAVAAFVPDAPLAAGATYTVRVTGAVTSPFGGLGSGFTDLAGNGLAADRSWSFTTAAADDATPPAVVSVTPAAGAAEVPATSPVVVTFSEPVARASITAASFAVVEPLSASPVAGTFSFAPGDAVVTFTPAAPLAGATTYTATLGIAVQDRAGNALAAPLSWSFVTDSTPPAVVAVDPADGTPGVLRTRSLAVTFSEPVDPTSVSAAGFTVEADGVPVAGSVTVSGNRATFTPSALFGPNATVTATVGATVRDLAGIEMGAPFSWIFGTDPSPLRVLATYPADFANGIPGSAPLVVTFWAPVDPSSIGPATFTVVADGVPVAGRVVASGSFATFVPVAPFGPFATVVATLAGTVRETGGVEMGAPFTWSFTTSRWP